MKYHVAITVLIFALLGVLLSFLTQAHSANSNTVLEVSGYMRNTMTLTWAGSATSYDVYRDNVKLKTVTGKSTTVSVGSGTHTLRVDAVPSPPTTTTVPPTTTTVPTTTTIPTGTEPTPIAGQGYHQVFGDEFNTLDRTVWDDHLWYDTVPDPRWTQFQTVHDGEFDLATSRTFRWNDVPSCPNPPSPTTNDLNCVWPWNEATTFSTGKKFLYGYFEARMKWTNAKGAWPAFWLYSYQHSADANQCTTQAGEIDVMEAQGDDGIASNGSEANAFYGTVHSNTNNCNPQDQQNPNNWQDMGTDLSVNWHKYAATWTSTQVSWYVDDKFVMSSNWPSLYPSVNQPMYLLLQMATGGWMADPDNTTPDYIRTEVDYVHVWQK